MGEQHFGENPVIYIPEVWIEGKLFGYLQPCFSVDGAKASITDYMAEYPYTADESFEFKIATVDVQP